MEILKTLVVILKLFRLKHVGEGETVVREGFFTKAAQCKVAITRR
jgi:benzoate 4-monooxygenase